jgi:hypothetical protein
VALTAQVFLELLVGGQRGGRWSDLPSLERAAGRAPAHQIEPGEHREAPAA